LGYAILDLPAGIFKRSKVFIFGIVNKDVSICEIKDLGVPIFASLVP